MSRKDPPLDIKILCVNNDNNQYSVKYQVPSFMALQLFRPAGEIVRVTNSESCPEDDVKAIRALCMERGFIYEEPTDHASGPSSGSSQKRPADGILRVSSSESCSKEDMKAIRALRRDRGFIDEEPAHASGATSRSSQKRPSSSSEEGKE